MLMLLVLIVAAYLLWRFSPKLRPALLRLHPDLVSRSDMFIAAEDPGRENRQEGGGRVSPDSLFNRLSRVFRSESTPEQPAPPAPTLPSVDIDYEDGRIPGKAKDRVRRILACLAEVETALSRETLPGFSGVDIIQLREEHLPRLIKSYVDIPEAHRAEIFRKTGKSASFILNDSLDQMQARIDVILRSLAQKDIDTFTNNSQFVRDRYSNQNPFD